MSILLLNSSKSYLAKVRSVEPSNLVGLWQQNEPSGSVSYDRSGHAHNGAYTGVTLAQPGVPNMRMSSAAFDGTNDYNDIHSAGLANDNLLSNPGFETAGGGDPDFWANWEEAAGSGTLANETTIVHEGTDAAKLTYATGLSSVYQSITVVAGKKYRLRFWTRGDGSVAGRYRVHGGSYLISPTTTGVTSTTWTMVENTFVVPAGVTSVNVWLDSNPDSAGDAYYDACEVRSMDGFLGDEGTLLAWAKVSAAGVWTDGDVRIIATLKVDAENWLDIRKPAGNNTISFYYEAGNTNDFYDATSRSGIDFVCYAITWNKSGDVLYYYIDGAQLATDTGLGTWVGDLTSIATVVGAGATTPSLLWSGEIGPVALWNKALTADQIAYLSKV